MSDQRPGVSARGILDGEVDALGGLCDSRGASVVGYCACVCGPERAVEAAAAAFAAFRSGAVRAPDPLSIDPEALLLGRTRAAAAQRAPRPVASLVFADIPCGQIPPLLAEQASGSIAPPDQDRLRQHLARCVSCQANQRVQEQAEQAYFHPTLDAVDPISRREIIEALVRAVPPPTPSGRTASGANGDPRPAATPAPGLAQLPGGQAEPRIPDLLPRTAAVTGRTSTRTPVGPSQPTGPSAWTPPPGAASPEGTPMVPVEIIRSHSGPGGVLPPAPPLAAQEPPPEVPPGSWDSPTGVMSVVDLDAALGHDPAAVDPAGHAGWADDVGAAPDPGGPPEDQPRRRRAMVVPFATAGVGKMTVPRVLGPVAVLAVGLLVALFVAGVFTGGSHRSSADPLSGAQNDPSTTIPTAGVDTTGTAAIGGGSTGGGGSTADGSPAASPGASTAATRTAARKRQAALARRLAGAGATGTAKPKTSSPGTRSAAGDSRTRTPTPGTPASKPKPKPTPTSQPTPVKPTSGASKPTSSRPATVHELGPAAGSAPPVTGVPATGATGYQPG